jgi:hypothetical protein
MRNVLATMALLLASTSSDPMKISSRQGLHRTTRGAPGTPPGRRPPAPIKRDGIFGRWFEPERQFDYFR